MTRGLTSPELRYFSLKKSSACERQAKACSRRNRLEKVYRENEGKQGVTNLLVYELDDVWTQPAVTSLPNKGHWGYAGNSGLLHH